MEAQADSRVTKGTCQKRRESDTKNARFEIVEYLMQGASLLFCSYSWCYEGGPIDVVGIALLASSKVKNTFPIGKCCITGNFPNTSTLYILIMPLLIFAQYGTPEISYNVGLCS